MTPLTTLTVVKAELNITDGTSDAALERLIARASGVISTYCGRDFGVRETTDAFGAAVRDVAEPLILSRYPVVSVESVSASGSDLAPDTFICEEEAGLLHRLATSGAQCSWRRDIPVTVTYRAGYETIPSDLEAVALTLITAAWSLGGRSFGVRSEATEGVGRTEYFERASMSPMALDSSTRSQLAAYRSRGT